MHHCLRCGRVLRSKKSRATGMGRTCYIRHLAERAIAEQIETIQLPPDPDKYIFQRQGNQPMTSVPSTVLMKSSGMDWGYAGPGSLDTAFNILLDHGLHPREAWTLQRGYMEEVIAALPWDGGEILKADVDAWIAGRRQGAA